jgi:glucokinase
MYPQIVVSADIGGSHITAAQIDVGKNSVVQGSYVRMTVNAAADADEILNRWSSALRQAMGGERFHVGIAVPGPFDYENGICLMQGNKKFESLFGMDLRSVLSNNLGVAPKNIQFRNDAASFLHGELLAGVLKGSGHAVGITLGTGIGSAWQHHDEVQDAELWRVPFRDGIAEDYISTRWFVKRYVQLTGENVANVEQLCATATPQLCKSIFSEFAINLAEFLAAFVRGYFTDAIVIGGNIAKVADMFLIQVTEILEQKGIQIPVKLAVLGEQAALIGAANCRAVNQLT